MQVRKQQLELDMEQETGSKQEKEYVKAVYCHQGDPVHSEGDQPWVFFGRTDAEAEAPVLWPPHAKS